MKYILSFKLVFYQLATVFLLVWCKTAMGQPTVDSPLHPQSGQAYKQILRQYIKVYRSHRIPFWRKVADLPSVWVKPHVDSLNKHYLTPQHLDSLLNNYLPVDFTDSYILFYKKKMEEQDSLCRVRLNSNDRSPCEMAGVYAQDYEGWQKYKDLTAAERQQLYRQKAAEERRLLSGQSIASHSDTASAFTSSEYGPPIQMDFGAGMKETRFTPKEYRRQRKKWIRQSKRLPDIKPVR